MTFDQFCSSLASPRWHLQYPRAESVSTLDPQKIVPAKSCQACAAVEIFPT
jgi:hypothetical protein